MEDTNGPELLAGRHFRDVFKPEESHRVVLYNLDPASTYDIYGYFREDSGAFANYDESVLVTLTTITEFTDLAENIDQIAYVGQNLIIPGTAKFVHGPSTESSWAVLPDYPDLFRMIGENVWGYGTDYTSTFDNTTIEYDRNNHNYLVITGISQNQQGAYKTFLTSSDSDAKTSAPGINLEIRGNL